MGRHKKVKPKQFFAAKGTHDILPEDQKYWEKIRQLSRTLFSYYNFFRIDTPHFEDTELFIRTAGEKTDLVEKQMYSFKTEGGDDLTLRPEGTPSIVRAYLQNGFVARPHPVKLYYSGSFFRHESPQRLRYRELNQAGLEIIGDENPVADAEIIHIFSVFLKELGIPEFFFHVNSVGCKECRPHYRSLLLQYYRTKTKSLCRDCKRRLKHNPLRLLDCKEEKCQIFKKSVPQILDNICEACKRHFTQLLEFLDASHIAYILNPYLVRGLDYYTRTVFEVFTTTELDSGSVAGKDDKGAVIGAEDKNVADHSRGENEENNPSANPPTGGLTGDGEKDAAEHKKTEDMIKTKKHYGGIAFGAGGRYDDLVQLLGGKPTPAVGGALGLERVIAVMKSFGVKVSSGPKTKVFFVQLGDFAKKESFRIMEELRDAGISVGESLGRDSVKSQLKIADRSEAELSLILGQKEAIDKTIIIREMTSGIQEVVPQEKFIDILKKKLRK